MKNILKTLALLLSLILYSQLVGFYSSHTNVLISENSQPSNKKSSNLTILSNQNNNCAVTNNSANTLYRLVPTVVKNTFNPFLTSIKVREQFLLHQFAKYTFRFKYLFYRVVHTQLIYPFHYFW